MGGHAFKYLHCPRMSPYIYHQVKSIVTIALQKVFTLVTVPFEVPGKADYGDCDFLVSAPLGEYKNFTLDTFPYQNVVTAIKHALGTPHGRRGFLTPTCLYFAIPMPSASAFRRLGESESSDEEPDSWVQVDLKICFKPEAFSWMTFELNYASQSSTLGSMVKPLGLTLDRDGLHVRVEEIESTNWAESMVWITKDPWTACRVLGLSRKAVDGGFESAEEIYMEYAGSWLFHPGSFKAKVEDESYLVQHTHRSNFLKEWIPQRYPGYKRTKNESEEEEVETWTARTRTALREKIFTTFPHVAEAYYVKRSQHVKEVEERKLRDLITTAIPSDTNGWRDDFDKPIVIIRHPVTQETESTPRLHPATMQHNEFTPPPSPLSKPVGHLTSTPSLEFAHSSLPLYIDALPRRPPVPCKPSPPPKSMSAAARLACLSRWTTFNGTGTPCLLSSPHAKDFELKWCDAIEAGCSEESLVKWAKDMWWTVWVRQCVVNWRGMWAKRFEKEDAKAEKARQQERENADRESAEMETRVQVEESARMNKEKVGRRLEGLSRALEVLGLKT